MAAGTVFNMVLLWKPGYCVNTDQHYKEIYKSFVGHEVGIFQIIKFLYATVVLSIYIKFVNISKKNHLNSSKRFKFYDSLKVPPSEDILMVRNLEIQ